MIKLSRKMEYALMSLKHVANKNSGELTTAKEIASQRNIPFDVTSRVLQIMARGKILTSIQGVQGGYKLAHDLSHVSLFDLVEMIEGPQGIVKCMNAPGIKCELIETCSVHSPLDRVNRKILEFCRTISVLEMIGLDQAAPSAQMMGHP